MLESPWPLASSWLARLRLWAPEVAIILGSGLSTVSQTVLPSFSFPMSELANGQKPTTPGHTGLVICGRWANRRVVVFQGRYHPYEGYDLAKICCQLSHAAQAGVRLMILTNAAGGIRDDLRPGSLMLVTGWLSWHGRHWHDRPSYSVRVENEPAHSWASASHEEVSPSHTPSWAHIYKLPPNPAQQILSEAARQMGLPWNEGVLAGVLGPNYETPAEIRALRALGADAVGMSTVLELSYATKLRLPVVAISCITNRAAGLTSNRLSHHEVLEQAGRCVTRFSELFTAFLRQWP
ncbi:MAG: purine-nucleoside phosphorylase [Gemmatales bacterium]|nr:purine-nucleoside phosphorylase [Gemmatales bacterium]MDW7993789.1 purine-nucleoside phosphorylase [Gemmatales bacterium]